MYFKELLTSFFKTKNIRLYVTFLFITFNYNKRRIKAKVKTGGCTIFTFCSIPALKNRGQAFKNRLKGMKRFRGECLAVSETTR